MLHFAPASTEAYALVELLPADVLSLPNGDPAVPIAVAAGLFYVLSAHP